MFTVSSNAWLLTPARSNNIIIYDCYSVHRSFDVFLYNKFSIYYFCYLNSILKLIIVLYIAGGMFAKRSIYWFDNHGKANNIFYVFLYCWKIFKNIPLGGGAIFLFVIIFSASIYRRSQPLKYFLLSDGVNLESIFLSHLFLLKNIHAFSIKF